VQELELEVLYLITTATQRIARVNSAILRMVPLTREARTVTFTREQTMDALSKLGMAELLVRRHRSSTVITTLERATSRLTMLLTAGLWML
jgi:hypothetical protein